MSTIPERIAVWPIFSYLKHSKNGLDSVDWVYFNEVPNGSYATLSTGQLKEFLKYEILNPNFKLTRNEAVWIREYLWNQEKHFTNKDWRASLDKHYELIFQA